MQISSNANELVRVPLSAIIDNPFQIRSVYDESALSALAESIQDVGLLQVPAARKVGDKFQLCFGHRRKKAFEKLYMSGLEMYGEMPLVVLELTDREMFESCLIENLKRADLDPIEKAKALKVYMDQFGANSVQAARMFGIPEGTIRGTIRLLKLPEEIQKQVRTGKLSQRQARKLLETPQTAQKRLQLQEDEFDLREQLIILFYDHMRWDISDQLLFKRVREAVELNKQLQRQVDLMNGRRLESDKLIPTRSRPYAGPVPSQ
jgi:ParB family chromosome partitioning protein